MFFSDSFLFILALLDTGAILFLLIYFVITLSDLECDYLNAQQCCSKLNQWMLPKLIAHTILSCLLLVHGHWLLVMINFPMALWCGYEILSIPSGNLGVFDPTEIHNRGQLKNHMRDCMIHLGYYLLFFFLYLYCLIISFLKDDPLNRDEEDDVIF
ncbi:protein cornichon homolog 4 [Harmonia axyridis]|uniref:protein cornichon homolog 4 n=1 Tax=Harmonia axyridis TaxID=115357 RepID=UPI001E279716|nr:protein cornichon homolog 4 [Harmonia axyridis]